MVLLLKQRQNVPWVREKLEYLTEGIMNYIPSQSCHPCDVLYSTKSYCSNELHPNAFVLRNHFTGDLVSYITTVTCNVFPVTYLCCMVSAKGA